MQIQAARLAKCLVTRLRDSFWAKISLRSHINNSIVSENERSCRQSKRTSKSKLVEKNTQGQSLPVSNTLRRNTPFTNTENYAIG
jgi:hypothetical protein